MTNLPPASAVGGDGPEDERPSAYVRFEREREHGPEPGEEPTENAVVIFGRSPTPARRARPGVPTEPSRPALHTVNAVAALLCITGAVTLMPRALAAADVPWQAVVALVVLGIAAPVLVFLSAIRRT